MREIKFRAWDKIDNRMRDNVGLSWFGVQTYELDNGGATEKVVLDRGRDCFELMQYTGLHDKNGKEIYEGDILAKTYPAIPPHTQASIDQTKRELPGAIGLFEVPHDGFPEYTKCVEVEWDNDAAQWGLPRDYDGLTALKEWSVTGNIYESPELLK